MYHQIKQYISHEYIDFSNHHQNKINLLFHVLSGIIYIISLHKLSNNRFLYYYAFLLSFTMSNTYIMLFIFLKLYIANRMYTQTNKNYIVFLFLLHCFIVPSLSHYFTNEIILLNYNNCSFIKLVMNILFFLPFSVTKYLEYDF